MHHLIALVVMNVNNERLPVETFYRYHGYKVSTLVSSILTGVDYKNHIFVMAVHSTAKHVTDIASAFVCFAFSHIGNTLDLNAGRQSAETS